MEVRYAVHPVDVKTYDTERLRKNFLIDNLFPEGELKLVYSHIDRMIIGSVCPKMPLYLKGEKDLGSEYFLERREIGIINIGAKGYVHVDGEKIELDARDGLYIGKGIRKVVFESENSEQPAKFYINSAPAHRSYPMAKIKMENTKAEQQGCIKNSNERTIYKYIHPEVCQSCQLVMGVTVLEENNFWNTMPAHTHDRRMEVYLYCDMSKGDVVFHMMGEPHETRHIVARNEQAVISPSWSIHSAVGTSGYTIIWSMAGENQTFTDVDGIRNGDLR